MTPPEDEQSCRFYCFTPLLSAFWHATKPNGLCCEEEVDITSQMVYLAARKKCCPQEFASHITHTSQQAREVLRQLQKYPAATAQSPDLFELLQTNGSEYPNVESENMLLIQE